MKIKSTYGYTVAGMALFAGVTGLFKCYDNKLSNNLAKRLQHMEYVKHNNFNKYIESLEIVNKNNSPRLNSEYIDNIWQMKAKEVKDSIYLTKRNKK